jgi:type IV secretion system protein VirB2
MPASAALLDESRHLIQSGLFNEGGFIMRLRSLFRPRRALATLAAILAAAQAGIASAQGFDKVNTTITNVNTILVTISIAVVTIAIIWAGFKMIFQGARLADVANVLIGGTLIGGAAAFATYIVS